MTGGEISLRDIWEAQQATDRKVSDLSLALAQFTGSVTSRLEAGQRHIGDLEERMRAVEASPKAPEGLEERVRRLEEFRSRWAGALIVLSLLLSALVAFLSHAGLVKAG